MSLRGTDKSLRILLGSPIFAKHYDIGLFWAGALSKLGHSLNLWDYRLQPEVPKVAVDFSFIIKGENVNPDMLPRPCVNYWPDSFGRSSGEEILNRYDLVFNLIRSAPEGMIWPRSSTKSTPEGMIWLPGFWEPLVHRDMGLERVVDTIYIGTANSEYKVKMIAAISPKIIFGNRWERHDIPAGPPQYLHDFVGIVNQAKILIDVHETQGEGVNNKLFEMIPAGFTIVDWVHGIDEIFPGIWDKFTFRTAEEARGLIQYYLSHEVERNELWQKQREAIKPYTYENSCLKILECLESVL